MTILQKLQVRQSEIRESINTLLGNDARTDDQQGELEKLTGEGQKLEPEIRAAIIASPDPAEVLVEGDAADVELRSLIHDASPGRILAAVHSRRNTDGREAELQEHFKVAGNELPHAMLETRAQTQAPSDVATQQAEIIQPIFGQTGAAFLNIPMPTVPAGAATYPVISSRPDPETPADGATVTADIPAGSFTADLLKPQAAQAQIEFSREDAASFPSMSDALGRVIGRASTPRVEVRESYTDTTIARLLAAASGAGDGGALAAIETAARWWGFGLASATVTPSTLALTALTPSVLDTIGRALCRAGESLHVIDVRRGRVTLTPCGGWAVHGSDDPASWTYRCDLSGPDGTRTVTRPGASVLHVRYAPHPSRPWKGRSPVRLAVDTARVAGLLENATAGELGFTQTQVLTPRRGAGDYALTDTLTPDTIEKIVNAVAEHVGTGAFVIPADVVPQRLGPEPPDSFALLRDRFEHSILSMCGIPPALVASRGTGTAMRESFRQILHALIRPLGSLLADELQAKLDPDAALSFDALRAGDITGTARAFGSLVEAGVTPQSAAAVVGLDSVEVREVSA